MKTLLKNRELSAFFAIVALFVVLVALNPAYFSLQTLAMIFASSQILCLLALGATLVMLTRNIDVSVGSTVGLCAIAVGVALNNGYGLATAIAFALAIGALAGAFNGLLVVGLRIPAIVATLGTLGLYRGVMLLWTGGKWIEGLPDSLKSLSEPAFLGVSPLGWLVLALLLAAGCCRAPPLVVIFTPLAITSPPRASWAWRSTARGCWPLPSTVCWRPAPGSSSPRRLALCLIRPAAAWR